MKYYKNNIGLYFKFDNNSWWIYNNIGFITEINNKIVLCKDNKWIKYDKDIRIKQLIEISKKEAFIELL